MKKHFLFVLLSGVLAGCVGTRLYVGQNRDGMLTLQNSVFHGSKQRFDSLLHLTGSPLGKVILPFSLPDDMITVSETETYRYKLTKGTVLYHQHAKTKAWKKVAFIPDVSCIEELFCSGDTVFVKMAGTTMYRYILSPATPKFDEKYVRR